MPQIRPLPFRLLVGIASLAVVAGCNVGEARLQSDPAAITVAPLPVQTAPADIADLYAHYQATSNIAADGEAEVPARVDGEVVEMLAEEGDPVLQGQILARIDRRGLEQRMLEARAELERRRSDFERQQSLHERGLVSSAAYDSLQFEVEELQAGYELGTLELSYTDIRAPISGVVSARHISLGQHVKPGDLLFRITDTSKLIATLRLPQTELARIRPGQRARFTVAAWPEVEFLANIERVSPTVNKDNGTFRATAYIDNDDGRLAPGMFGDFEIDYERFDKALVVPAQSVAQEDDETVVYRVREGIAERLPVDVGIEVDGQSQILGGLDAGDQVITSGVSGLQNGARVRSTDETPDRPGS